ncbi:hypothetical protein HY251_21085 [bacterium]|nr:hypothetical protein [bacterium]
MSSPTIYDLAPYVTIDVPKIFRTAIEEFVSTLRNPAGRVPMIFQITGGTRGSVCADGIFLDLEQLWVDQCAFTLGAVHFQVLHELGHNFDCREEDDPALVRPSVVAASHAREFRADEFATRVMLARGMSLAPAIRWLEARGRCRLGDGCWTHPDGPARIANIEARIEAHERAERDARERAFVLMSRSRLGRLHAHLRGLRIVQG